MTKQTYKLYQIDWMDAYSDSRWEDLEDWKPAIATVHSIGWKVYEDDNLITLAQNISSFKKASDRISIPKNWITKKKLLKGFNVSYVG